MRLYNKIALALYVSLVLGAVTSITGCTKFHYADVKDGYATDYPLSPTEYTIYVSKETSAASNILYTRMAMASKVIAGSYPWEDETENAEEAVSKMQSIVDGVTTTMPPESYESDRQAFLDQLEQAKTYLEDYQSHLENRDTAAIKSDITLFESSFLSLGGDANIAYE